MRKLVPIIAFAVVGMFVVAGNASADAINYFTPSSTVFFSDIYNAGQVIGVPSAFGFFYKGDPSAPVPIFVQGSQPAAEVDFVNGRVYDISFPDPNTPTLTLAYAFTPQQKDIGFVYSLDLSSLGLNSVTLYSDALLNPGAKNEYASQSLNADTYITAFFADPEQQELLSIDAVGGITPAVPEPGTLLLLGAGIVAWLAGRKLMPRAAPEHLRG